ncbi:MAG: hypothetical protein U9Q96_01140 [Patescibacteria group bacterium]|nr:hypothetical protein [Patescibacteria group bacterium]
MSKINNKKLKTDKIVIYKSKKGGVELEVRFEDETVWLRQNEIANLFGKDRSVITKHINKIFNDKEISKKAMCIFCTL